MSLIVVEGVDGSGKSTLLENARIEIPKRYFIQIRHSCRPLDPYHILNLLDLIQDYGETLDVMLDRHPLISEPIYAALLRPGTDLTVQSGHWPDFESRAKHLQVTVDRIIYCRPSLESVKRNIAVQPQLAGIAEKIEELYDWYDRAMVSYSQYLPVLTYDYKLQDRTLADLFFGKL